MAALVIGDALAVLAREQQRALGPEHDLLERIEEVLLAHRRLLAPRREQRRFVHEVLEIGAREARRRRRELVEVDVGRERHLARVHLEDRLAPALSGRLTTTRRSKRPGRSSARSSTSGWLVAASTMTPSRPEKPSISVRIWFSVCSCSLGAADRHLAARAADGVDLVDEDDRRRVLARLLEQIAHARRAHADDHLDELGGAHREERHARLAGDRLARAASCRCRASRSAARPSAPCRRGACTSRATSGNRRSPRARSRLRRCRRRRRT